MTRISIALAFATLLLSTRAASYFTNSVMSDISSMTNGQRFIGYDASGRSVLDTSAKVHWWATNCISDGYEQQATVIADESGKRISIEADDNTVFRTLDRVTDILKPIGPYHDTGVEVYLPDNGICLDTDIQFTGTDEQPEYESYSKILVWLNTVEDDLDTPLINEGRTNLIVTCGYPKYGVIEITNRTLNAHVVPGDWHRLTIKAKRKSYYTYLSIYLDGTLLSADDGTTEFMSLAGYAYADRMLSYVGFKGTVGIKRIDMLTPYDSPEFARDKTYITVTWDDNVTALTIGDTNIIRGQTSPYAYRITDFSNTLMAVVSYTTGYRKASITQTDLIDYTEENNIATFKVSEFSKPTITVKSELDRDEATLSVNGEPVTEAGTLLQGILNYVDNLRSTDSAVITLGDKDKLGNIKLYTLDNLLWFDGDTVLDLHGCTVEGVGTAPEGWSDCVLVPGKITIRDTVGGGALIAPTNLCLLYTWGDSTIEKAYGREIEFTGDIFNGWYEDPEAPGTYTGSSMTILGGKFTKKPINWVKDPVHETENIKLGTDDNPLMWSNAKTNGFWILLPYEQETNSTVHVTETRNTRTALSEGNSVRMRDVRLPTKTIRNHLRKHTLDQYTTSGQTSYSTIYI